MEENRIVCKKCGSSNVEINCGMFIDTYHCSDCGNDWHE